MQRDNLRRIIRWLLENLTHIHASGVDNIPSTGGYILAVNHMSRLDPPLVFAFIERSDVSGLVADKYLHYPFIRWIVNTVQGIWINRDEADFRALRKARQFLLNGGMLGIAPEGTRSHTGGLIPAKTGVAYLADKANVPVLPVAVFGTENAFRQLFHLKRPHIHVIFGEPFRLPPVRRAARETDLQRNTDEIMCRIAQMLPPAYRGVYRDHPLLDLILNKPHGVECD